MLLQPSPSSQRLACPLQSAPALGPSLPALSLGDGFELGKHVQRRVEVSLGRGQGPQADRLVHGGRKVLQAWHPAGGHGVVVGQLLHERRPVRRRHLAFDGVGHLAVEVLPA